MSDSFRSLARAMFLGFRRDRGALFFTIALPLFFLLLIGGLLARQSTPKSKIAEIGSVPVVDQMPAQMRADLGKSLPVLLQINAGRDPAKFGAELEDAPRLLDAALAQRHLRVEGLMAIAPLSSDPAVAQRTFATLRELRDRLAAQTGAPLRELSMGMSGDLAAAIAAGSTMVRVGTALFGTREATA